MSRRWFLATGAALAGAAALAGDLSENIHRAASVSASADFDLSQVKHLVFLMQEDRSFDGTTVVLPYQGGSRLPLWHSRAGVRPGGRPFAADAR